MRVFGMPTRADCCPGAKISPTARCAPATAGSGSGRTAFTGSVGVACLDGVSSAHTGCHAGAEGSDAGSGSMTLEGSDGGASTLASASSTNRYPAAGGAGPADSARRSIAWIGSGGGAGGASGSGSGSIALRGSGNGSSTSTAGASSTDGSSGSACTLATDAVGSGASSSGGSPDAAAGVGSLTRIGSGGGASTSTTAGASSTDGRTRSTSLVSATACSAGWSASLSNVIGDSCRPNSVSSSGGSGGSDSTVSWTA